MNSHISQSHKNLHCCQDNIILTIYCLSVTEERRSTAVKIQNSPVTSFKNGSYKVGHCDLDVMQDARNECHTAASKKIILLETEPEI